LIAVTACPLKHADYIHQLSDYTQTVTHETKHNTELLLLERHFSVRRVTALQWSGSELLHVTKKLEVFLFM